MRAISLVHQLFQVDKEGGPKWSRSVYFEPFIAIVNVQWRPTHPLTPPPPPPPPGKSPRAMTLSQLLPPLPHPPTPREISKGYDLVTFTASHPPGQAYKDKASSTASTTPNKYAEPYKEEIYFHVTKSELKRQLEAV
ncbi:hypothetical protein ACOSP7_013004 [Xanthoceras sorbifolium]